MNGKDIYDKHWNCSNTILEADRHTKVTIQVIINELQDILDSRRKLDAIRDKIATLKQQMES